MLDLIQLAPEKVAGDLAFPCFQFAKEKGINPAQFAKEIATKLEDQAFPFFEKIVAVGPYVNAFLDHGQMASEILKEIQEKKADYGRGLSKGKTVLLE